MNKEPFEFDDIDLSKTLPIDVDNITETIGNHPKKKKKRKRKRRIWTGVLMTVLIIVVAGWIAVYLLDAMQDMFGMNQESVPYEVVIEQGASANDIALQLEEEGVIRSGLIFRLYARVKKADQKFQYGTFFLNSAMSYDEIYTALSKPNLREDVVSVTFTEGMTVREIANKLEDEGVCKAAAFYAACDTIDLSGFMGGAIVEHDMRYFRLEGYLFPDTYEFYLKQPADAVILKMLGRFEEVVKSDIVAQAKAQGFTLDELVTFASIIQAEAGTVEDMSLVSSVFNNRLASKNFPNLESDPTGLYVDRQIFKVYKASFANEVEEYKDLYSTYRCVGLPIGPVNNPGIDAIKAVLAPTDTPYYFFVSDVNGKIYYATTDAEHEANKKIASKVKRETSSAS